MGGVCPAVEGRCGVQDPPFSGGGPASDLAVEIGGTNGFSLVLSPCRWSSPHRIVGHLPAAGMVSVNSGRPIGGCMLSCQPPVWFRPN